LDLFYLEKKFLMIIQINFTETQNKSIYAKDVGHLNKTGRPKTRNSHVKG
jgi:hypothetical protein